MKPHHHTYSHEENDAHNHHCAGTCSHNKSMDSEHYVHKEVIVGVGKLESDRSDLKRYHSFPSEGVKVSLAAVATETNCRRARLIHDTWGSINDYYIVEEKKLGQGSFGYVCKGQSRETYINRAIKSLSKARAKETRKRYRQEILIMKMTDHPNIIKLFETFEDKNHVFLVMELCTGGNLNERVKKVGCFQEKDTAAVMQQILRPVFYMHEKRICHRDIKPENFLLLTKEPVHENTLKLIDFGFSCTLKKGQMLTTKLGTPWYSSPQVLAGQYDESCDVWSCGVIMYVLLSGQPPFHGKTDAEVMQNVKRGNYAFKGPVLENLSDMAKDMIRKMLKYQPQDRWTAGQALCHAYIKKLSPEVVGNSQLLTPSLLVDLRNFCSQSVLRRAALQVVAQQLSQEDTKALRRAFTALDSRGAGILTVAALSESIAQNVSQDLKPEVEKVISELGSDAPEAEICFTEFLAATLEQRHYMQEGPCQAAFRAFDRNGDGWISQQELEQVLLGTGSEKEPTEGAETSEDIAAILKAADVNGDGVLDFQEFHQMLRGEGPSGI